MAVVHRTQLGDTLGDREIGVILPMVIDVFGAAGVSGQWLCSALHAGIDGQVWIRWLYQY